MHPSEPAVRRWQATSLALWYTHGSLVAHPEISNLGEHQARTSQANVSDYSQPGGSCNARELR